MLNKIRTTEYLKLVKTFFRHLIISLIYGESLSIIAQDFGMPLWICNSILIFIIIFITYIAYTEEINRYYPFSKLIVVNILGLFLWLIVALTKVYLLNIFALIIVIFAIKYRCSKCVEFKRYSFE